MSEWENLPKGDTKPKIGDYRIIINKGVHWGWWWNVEQYGKPRISFMPSSYLQEQWCLLNQDGSRVSLTDERALSNRWAMTKEKAEKRARNRILYFEGLLDWQLEAERKKKERLAQNSIVNVSATSLKEDFR